MAEQIKTEFIDDPWRPHDRRRVLAA
jgi:hypothetical protein